MESPSDWLGPGHVVAGVALIITLVGFWLAHRTRRFLATAKPAIATYLGCELRSADDGAAMAETMPKFRFVTERGEEAEFSGRAGLRLPRRKDQRVAVLYDPERPSHATVHDLIAIHGAWIGLVGVGLLLLLAACWRIG